MPRPTQPTPKEYEQIGRMVEDVLLRDYVELLGNTRRQLRLSFLRGIAAGLGGVIGATVVVALVVWLLHLFGGLPVVGHWLQGAGNQIKTK